MTRGFEKGRCPLCREEKHAILVHILLKCLEMKKWRKNCIVNSFIYENNKLY
jgi:hypothetical protein